MHNDRICDHRKRDIYVSHNLSENKSVAIRRKNHFFSSPPISLSLSVYLSINRSINQSINQLINLSIYIYIRFKIYFTPTFTSLDMQPSDHVHRA